VKIVVVVQARLASHRLPGKVLLDLVGAPVLQRMLERVLLARTPFDVVVATSDDASCDDIVALCRRRGYACFRGHPTDLLDRHLAAARWSRAEVVVKIPSDCPLIDPRAIDRVLGDFVLHAGSVDFGTNLHPPTYPDGNDVEVMTREALEQAHSEAKKPHEREHTTPFIWERPERFRLRNVRWETDLDYSKTHRFTLDYVHDYHFIRAVYDALWTPTRPGFSLEEILSFLEQNPDVRRLNAQWLGDSWQRRQFAELQNPAALGLESQSSQSSFGGE
jgi:spore coat polysaccharide biosynthesis protein SpsF